jgi:hypothetical protein
MPVAEEIGAIGAMGVIAEDVVAVVVLVAA